MVYQTLNATLVTDSLAVIDYSRWETVSTGCQVQFWQRCYDANVCANEDVSPSPRNLEGHRSYCRDDIPPPCSPFGLL